MRKNGGTEENIHMSEEIRNEEAKIPVERIDCQFLVLEMEHF